MKDDNTSDFPIDAVITWVDGADLNWRNKFNKYTPNPINWSNKKDSIRYNSIDEIELAILSIIRYASFMKNIYLVTDNQKPDCFDSLVLAGKKKGVNVEIVDHKDIFRNYEECLPSFNSRSISIMLFRVPNLNEHFVIFNDDTFLMRDTKVFDYFENGKPVIRGKWAAFYEDKKIRNAYHRVLTFFGKPSKASKSGFKKAQQVSAQLLGLNKYVLRDHTPIPVRKSTLENYFEGNNLLRNNAKHRFRNESQFIISSLANHLEILSGDYNLTSNLALSYFQSYKNNLLLRWKLFWFDKNKNKLFVCFQNLEVAKKKELQIILNWVNKKLD